MLREVDLRSKMLRRITGIILLLLLTVGCARTAAAQPTATPGASPTILPTPIPVTATKEVVSTETFPTVRIKNAETGTYLYEQDGQGKLGDIPIEDESSQWVIEDDQGGKRIQNRTSGNYLSIEHLKEYVEVISIYPEWMSPRWVFEGDPSQGSIVIRNVWHNWQVLYIKDGKLSYERVPTTANNARWMLEPINGVPLAANTPISVVVIPTASNPVGSLGASVPWIETEAENEQTNGEVLAPDRTFGTIASESSGRSAVQLDQV